MALISRNQVSGSIQCFTEKAAQDKPLHCGGVLLTLLFFYLQPTLASFPPELAPERAIFKAYILKHIQCILGSLFSATLICFFRWPQRVFSYNTMGSNYSTYSPPELSLILISVIIFP